MKIGLEGVEKLKIMNLRERIRNGTANRDIAHIQLVELLAERDRQLKDINEKNHPAKDLTQGEKSKE